MKLNSDKSGANDAEADPVFPAGSVSEATKTFAPFVKPFGAKLHVAVASAAVVPRTAPHSVNDGVALGSLVPLKPRLLALVSCAAANAPVSLIEPSPTNGANNETPFATRQAFAKA